MTEKARYRTPIVGTTMLIADLTREGPTVGIILSKDLEVI